MLVYNNIPVKKTHNLVVLLGIVVPVYPLWEAWRKSLRLLNSYAVEFRYPGDTATQEEAEESYEIAKALRFEIRKELGL